MSQKVESITIPGMYVIDSSRKPLKVDPDALPCIYLASTVIRFHVHQFRGHHTHSHFPHCAYNISAGCVLRLEVSQVRCVDRRVNGGLKKALN